MIRDKIETDRYTLYADCCLSVMPKLESASVDLIVADPPYNGVKDAEWDNQWKTDADYLAWLGSVLNEFHRVLKPNGTLYLFASPQMAWGVEGEVRRRFTVLQRITWAKPEFSTKAEMNPKEWQRQFFPVSEAVFFAEQRGADETADSEVGYSSACEQTKRSIFGDYLRSEFKRAGVVNRHVAALFPSASGGMTGCVSNWLLGYNCPTKEQYEAMRRLLNKSSGEYLRREYEDLRREYEDLRRPFSVSADVPYTDVWDFPTVQAYKGKHVCEKPLAMLAHIVKASSRPDAVVLDPFMGSGALGQACVELGRKYIGVEKCPKWMGHAAHRIGLAGQSVAWLGLDPVRIAREAEQGSLEFLPHGPLAIPEPRP